MSRLMDAWTAAEERPAAMPAAGKPAAAEKADAKPSPKKMGRPSATLDRTKTIKSTSIKMAEDDFIYCTMLAKELKEDGVCGGDVSSLIAHFIKQSRALNPEVSKAAEAIYELQNKRRKR